MVVDIAGERSSPLLLKTFELCVCVCSILKLKTSSNSLQLFTISCLVLMLTVLYRFGA